MNRAIVITDHVKASLLAYAPQGIGAGQPLQLGLQLEHKDGWHTYWKNPGDSGLPVTLAWTLPAGVTAGPIAWPVPKRLPYGPLVNYGYDGTVLLPVALQGAGPGALDVKLHAEWLVCKEICLPESGAFALRLAPGAPLLAERPAFEAAAAAAPRPSPGAQASARVDGGAAELAIDGLPADWHGRQLLFFPENAGVFDHAAASVQRWDGARLVLRAPLSAMRSESPAALNVVLAQPGTPGGIALSAQVPAWPAAAASAQGADISLAVPAPPAQAAAPPAWQAAGSPALALLLLFALLGGALLNLMPCVFPVLSLKAVSMAQRGGSRRHMLAGGLAYTGGVVASFLALAGGLLALRAGGSLVGWGFQLQSPLFVAALALLFTLIGLNLLGVFEVATLLPGRVAAYRARNPLLDDALSGAVAVAIASPCTAPLMGAAVGAALAAPWPLALGVFAALGLGMAAPYLALSAWPRLARLMPRPGPWMARFKSLLAFPMFATVIWLAWVLGQQAGADGMAALLVLLLCASLAVWLCRGRKAGESVPKGGVFGRALGPVAGIGVLAGALAWALPLLQAPQPALATAAAGQWQAWSPQAVADARAAGRPVFVDFTAAWCITCQFNKRTTLNDAQVLRALARKQVVLMRADWTNRDARIARQLQELGRVGVPVYALYSASEAAPQLLPEVLSADAIHSALARL
jgi:thiol:disulfide interchange protein DsbD